MGRRDSAVRCLPRSRLVICANGPKAARAYHGTVLQGFRHPTAASASVNCRVQQHCCCSSVSGHAAAGWLQRSVPPSQSPASYWATEAVVSVSKQDPHAQFVKYTTASGGFISVAKTSRTSTTGSTERIAPGQMAILRSSLPQCAIHPSFSGFTPRPNRRARAFQSVRADAYSPRGEQALVVVGSLNADTVLTIDRLPEAGETMNAKDLSTFPGGKACRPPIELGC